jgi:hypothetical protein
MRARFVDRAATCLAIKKYAHRLVMLIFVMAKYNLAFIDFGVTCFGHLYTHF